MDSLKLFPHIWTFGAYLTAMSGGLLLARFYAYLGLYLSLLACLAWLTHRRQTVASPRSRVHHLLFFPCALNITFPAMADAIPAIRPFRYDDFLLALDQTLFAFNPNVWAERLVSPLLTEVMSLCYVLFMPLLYVSLIRYFFRQQHLLDTFYRGIFTVYGLGFLGYLTVPAAGPYLAHPELFITPLTGGPITRLTQAMVQVGSNRVDVFPSLHCAVSAYILCFAYRHHRREFWWLLLPVFGLWCSTIYLRYHYLIDVLCGFALACLALTLCRRQPTLPASLEYNHHGHRPPLQFP
ncbi:MAG: hypothetical protein BWK76_22165 [Desulfobulbaceae bacterium A2]|nr:MAG: hypothetical protein BWK76_22165 [Desulfobulbaceae bacterium A2]